MTWKERTIARILLIVATMLADNPGVRQQIDRLATEIQVHGRTEGDVP